MNRWWVVKTPDSSIHASMGVNAVSRFGCGRRLRVSVKGSTTATTVARSISRTPAAPAISSSSRIDRRTTRDVHSLEVHAEFVATQSNRATAFKRGRLRMRYSAPAVRPAGFWRVSFATGMRREGIT
jgi:hypothetical protein